MLRQKEYSSRNDMCLLYVQSNTVKNAISCNPKWRVNQSNDENKCSTKEKSFKMLT